MTSIGMRKVLQTSYDETLVRIPEALKAEGFGVLTQIDVQQTLKEKLGVAFNRYKIFGACNPPLAHQALQADLDAGVMLPCNIVVYEGPDNKTVVLAVDPMQSIAASGNPKLVDLAETVKQKLTRVLAVLESVPNGATS